MTAARRTTMSEAELQMQVVALLDAYARPDIEWHHCPNGDERHPAIARKLKKMGVQRGVADLMFLIDGKAHAVELKTEIGTQSSFQEDFQTRFERAGGVYHIAFGLDQAVTILITLNAFRPGFNFNISFGGRVVRRASDKARVSNAPWNNQAVQR
jgi:hypothetical protein